MPTALFIGRFQPFHKGHLADIKSILEENDKIVIGIGSSQESNTAENPFSLDERKKMVRDTLNKNKIKNYELCEIPDFFDDDKWIGYIKAKLPKFDAAYSGNEITIKVFEKKNIKTKKIKLIEGINATDIRKKIKNGEKWEHLVPKEIFDFINKVKGVEG